MHNVRQSRTYGEQMTQQHVSIRAYVIVFVALMALLVATVLAYRIPFRQWGMGPLVVVVAFAIATVKAVLVVLYFMHVKQASRLTKVFVVTGLAWLAILMALTLNDYLTRSWQDMSKGWTEEPIGITEHPVRAGAEH